MPDDYQRICNLGTAVGRWAGIGPYYAMFPVRFAFDVIAKYSEPGGAVLDPFAGRASSVFAASALGRSACGIEINPVGWLYGRAKLSPAPEWRVLKRIQEVGAISESVDCPDIDTLPYFYHYCYSRRVLKYLATARQYLRWKDGITDATVMALILVYLHGKIGQSLSNQMRQGKAMSPDYSVRWWIKRLSAPPDIDPSEFLLQRAKWRYAKGTPYLNQGRVILGDSRVITASLLRRDCRPFDLLFTSPPYCGVTNYHYDQWLRLWMLGDRPYPASMEGDSRGRFTSKVAYRELLGSVFSGCAGLMKRSASIYVRTDARKYTFEVTLDALKAAFPRKRVRIAQQPFSGQTQTALYGDKTAKPGEVDIVLTS